MPEILPAGALLCDFVHQAVVGVTGNDAVRRQALDRERAGDADARIVGVGLVVEIFELGLGRDRGVDLLLPRDPRLPPLGVNFLSLFQPIRPGLARNLPFLPRFVRASRRALRAPSA